MSRQYLTKPNVQQLNVAAAMLLYTVMNGLEDECRWDRSCQDRASWRCMSSAKGT